MSAADLLHDLDARGIELWFEGERLRFRAPKGALTPELRARLVASRTEVLARLREAAANDVRVSPLSYSQRSLWFVHQRSPLSAAYNVAFSARVVSPLDERALRQAVQALVDRHGSLRTTYVVENGLPSQRLAGVGSAQLDIIDVPGIDDAALHRLVAADYRRPFDLERGPLFRTSVYRRAPDDQVLLLVMHHIAVDGWSLLQLVDELQALYTEATGGAAATLQRPEIEFVEFTKREADMLAGAEGGRLASYWAAQLAEPRAWLELPSDRPREIRRAAPGAATYSFDVDGELSTGLRQLARDEGVTLFIVMLAAWKTLLYRYTGTTDVVVGTPTFGRNRPEVARVVGNFVNSIPLRSRLAADMPFRALLRELRQTVLDGLDAAEYPLGLMVERLQTTRDLTRSPFFGNLFVMQRFDQLKTLEPVLLPGSDDAVTLGALRLKHYALDQQEGQFDITLQVIDKTGPLAAQLKYDSDLHDAATIARLAEHYRVLLAGAVADPARALDALPLLSTVERAAMIDAAGTPRSTTTARTLHTRFEEQVRCAPDAIAMSHENERVTYAELNRRANRLAHRLRSLGVGPETLVGLCTERSVDMIVALVGILKAGGAYLPIDLSYPPERVEFMLRDAGAPVLVTQRALAGKLPAHSGATVFVDDEASAWPDANLDAGATPDSLAYVIYTSGSTGQPKGTMMTHRAVDRLFTSTDEWYGFGPRDNWTLFHSVAFDFSVWEIWGALLYGGTLTVVPYWISRSPEAFLELILRERVTVLNQTPSAFRQLVAADAASGAPRATSLRYVIFGGEALELQSLKPWFDRHGDEQPSLVNMYGITETCVHVTYRPITLRDLAAGAGSVIGVPIPDLQVHVLDARREPLPYLVTGEMFVGGPGLARGYLNRPDLTDARFVPDPFHPGARLYRTGDLARRLPSGDLEYLGRSDQQVKIRGFRIELGEIEAALGDQTSVRDKAVVLREDTPGDKRLVAYLVVSEETPHVLDDIRAALRARLPDYMVPAAFVFMDKLPLTSNGKIDRHALPAPDLTRASSAEYVGARNRVEEVLVDVWTDVLGADTVGVHDNFFELGGDSILSMQVIARALQHGVVLTPRQLFEHQTIAALAGVAESRDTDLSPHAADEAASGSIPLTPIQRWFTELDLPEPHHFNQSVLLEVPADLRTEHVRAAFARILDHHDALRLRVRRAPEWRQEISSTESADVVEHVDLADASDAELRAQLDQTAAALHASLDLERGPLVRVAHVTRGAGVPGRLLIVIHHLAVDGVSWRVLLDDLDAGYQRASRGETIALPPKTTSFARWAQLLERHAASDESRRELEYWHRVATTGAPRLPANRSPGDNRYGSAREVVVELAPDETRSLLQDVPSAYGTQINDVLLAALARTLTHWLDAEQIRIDLEGHGREDVFDGVDLSRTVGWFTSMFPVLLTAPRDAGVAETLKSVKEQLRAIPTKGFGYGVLRYLAPPSEAIDALRVHGGSEIAFNYLGQLDQSAKGTFRFAPERVGPDRAPSGTRSHLLEINALVRGGQLATTWSYGDGVLPRDVVERLAASFAAELRAIVAHCTAPRAVEYTPSDFPLARLDQAGLDRLLANLGARRAPGAGRDIEDVYPLTPMQQGMLFHTLLAPESGVYFQQLAFTIDAPFDSRAFANAWRLLIARHAVLRTSFVWDDVERPLQVVHANVELPIEQHDWRALSASEQESRLAALLADDRRRGFRLDRAPLLRLTFVQLADDRFRFIGSFHHLLFDGWSLAVLLRELFASYAATVAGTTAALEPVRPYRGYLAWLDERDAGAAERHWRTALAGLRSPTSLGIERDMTTIDANSAATSAGHTATESSNAVHDVTLPSALVDDIQAFAQTQRVTVNSLIQGLWGVLLGQYSGSTDVIFGATVAGRPADLRGVESMVGLFINTLPVRVTIDPSMPLAAWLTQLQARNADMRQFEYASLVDIQGWTDVPRGTPLFQSILVFENYPVDASLRDGAVLSLRDPQVVEYTNYPMTLFAKPGPTFSLGFSFDTQRFDEADVAQLSTDFVALLERAIASPERALGSLLTEAESVQAILARLRAADIRVSLDGEKLRVNAPKGGVADSVKALIAARRDAIVATLRARRAREAASATPAPIAPTAPIAPARADHESLAFWKRELAGAPARLELPTDRPRPASLSSRRARIVRSLDASTLEQLDQTSAAHDTTLFATILAALQVVLHRYSGQDDVVVGSTVGVSSPREQRAGGAFENWVALRGRLGDDPTFGELLERAARAAADAVHYAALPFEAVVDAVQPERSANHAPLFQVALYVDSVTDSSASSTRLDLAVDAARTADGLAIAYDFAADLFVEETIARLHTSLARVLRAAATDLTSRVNELPLLGAEDAKVLLEQWTDTAMEHDRSRTLHRALESIARSQPNAVAVVAGEDSLTYAELDARANRLAQLLARRGVARGSLVAVCVDRTLDMPIAIAAVLKAGAAYVPLDPTHPAERTRFTLDDAGVACVITPRQFVPLFDGASAPLVVLDEIGSELAAVPDTPPDVAARPEDRAYVIYTSGSTGRPKGVEVEHRNVMAFLEAMRREPGFERDDVLLAVTTLSFDIAGLELWLPLTVGGRVVIASRTDVLDGQRLIVLLDTHGATVMQATPATWRLMIDAGWNGKRDLEALCGGEALPRDVAAALVARAGSPWNMYGPTETTIWSTVARITNASDPITIGKPIANTRVYILEASGQPAPIGVPGELCIAGEGVARGYHERPQLTAEKFVTIALPNGRSERVYRTGDLARFRRDGSIEFIGRRDHQVKVRGYRIELGEIESVLAAHAGVKQAVVTVREDRPGDQRLAAYVVPADGANFDADDARTALRRSLPEYMVPSVFTLLPQLPLTPNGKIDRKALPAPRAASDAPVDDSLMTPPQRRVAAAWRKVLDVAHVGLHDNFFDIGGHSLLLVQLHGALNREFAGNLELVELFQFTTVAAQAARLSTFGAPESALKRARARAARQSDG